jgi:hypothetical protein
MADVWFGVRKRSGGGLCTTQKGSLVPADFERCSGPYDSETKASAWIEKNCDAGFCSKKSAITSVSPADLRLVRRREILTDAKQREFCMRFPAISS